MGKETGVWVPDKGRVEGWIVNKCLRVGGRGERMRAVGKHKDCGMLIRVSTGQGLTQDIPRLSFCRVDISRKMHRLNSTLDLNSCPSVPLSTLRYGVCIFQLCY